MPAPTPRAPNERLEFLGDRVLGLIVAERLHALYPDDAEGALALKFNALVRRRDLRARLRGSRPCRPLILASSEAGSGGRHKAAILGRRLRGGDRGALSGWRDGGGARALSSAIGRKRSGRSARDMRDAKTRAAGMGAVAQAGEPLRRSIRWWGATVPTTRRASWLKSASRAWRRKRGEGGSKREAEQDAAAKMLDESWIGAMTQRCGFAAIIGAPECRQVHAGQRAGRHPRSPSSRPRCRPRACRCAASRWRGETQIVFVDTPGIFRPRRRLDRAMVESRLGGRGGRRRRAAARRCGRSRRRSEGPRGATTRTRSSKA